MNLHASDFCTIWSGHPLYKVRKKAGIQKEQSLHFSKKIDSFSCCHNLSSPYVKAAHVVHFSGLQIRGFFCITSPKHQGGSKNRHHPQNKNCRVFGRMFCQHLPLLSECLPSRSTGFKLAKDHGETHVCWTWATHRHCCATVPTNALHTRHFLPMTGPRT